VYFITFCTYRRERWLACEAVQAAFVKFAERACEDFNIAVGRFVIMPDHIHLFVCGGPDFIPGRWIGMLKQTITKAMPTQEEKSANVWQDGFFDHLLRNDESMAQKWEYVRQNPVRAGLMAHYEDWPYQGEVVLIDRA